MHYNVVFWIILAIVVVQFIWGQVLSALNRSRMSDVLPKELEGIYEPEEYKRQQQYQRTNSRFALVEGSVSTVCLLAILITGALGWFETVISQHLTSHFVLLPLVFVIVFSVLLTVFSLPFNYYDTFVIEERFGFNKSTRGLFFADTAKSLALSLILIGVVIVVVAWLYHLTVQWFWLIAWGVLTLFSVGIGYFYSELIVPLFNKQKPLEEGELRDGLFELAQRVGFQLRDVYVMDSSKRSTKSNAYFTGFGKRKRIVLYDTLIDELETNEIVAVLAHEIGHYRKHHILIGMAIEFIKNGVMLWLLSLFLGSVDLAQALGSPIAEPSFLLGLIGFGLIFAPVSELLSVAESILSRRHEYQSDQFAARLGLTEPFISGLKKIEAKALSNLTPHPLVVFWNYSHPTLLQRIKSLGPERSEESDKRKK